MEVLPGLVLRIVRDRVWDQWIVKVYRNGRYVEDESYFTDDKNDAEQTMELMAKQYRTIADKKRL